MRITGIVPMRHNSERVPGKNYRNFGGIPLYHHIIKALEATPEIDQVVIDTDSPFIINEASKVFPKVIILERPENLRDGAIPMNDVLLNTITKLESDFFLQTHSTNPLLKSSTISQCLNEFLENQDMYDSLFSVTRLHTRLWDQHVNAVNHDPAVLLRTQDLPPIFEENSCMYLFTESSLRESGNRIGKKPLMFEMDPEEAIDIDVELDFRLAEFLYRERNK